MRYRRSSTSIHEGDLTPMIDITFQLVAFFMVVINFSQTEQNELIQLPTSTLAKPPDQPVEYPITINVHSDGSILYGGERIPSLERLRPYLANEATALRFRGRSPSDATVIIRAHRDVPTGKVQELIALCQELRFEQFRLRAIEEVVHRR